MLRLGLDLGGTKLAAALVDHDGVPFREAWMPHRVHDLASLLRLLEQMSELLQLPPLLAAGDVAGAGFSIAGWLDRSRTRIRNAANLGLEDIPLVDELATLLPGLPLALINDGDATLWGERTSGAARGVGSSVLFAIGTGLGGAVIQDDTLVTGGFGLGGELGHLPMGGDAACVCGGTGCLETLVSGRVLGERAEELAASGASPALARRSGAGARLTARDLGDAARQGDPAAAQAIADAASALARAIRILIPVLDPQTVVIGGSVAEGIGDLVIPLIERGLAASRFVPALHPAPAIVAAELRGRAAVLGAAAWAPASA